MPLLPKEVDIAPAELFSLGAEERPWMAAHVRSRQEKVLARHLLRNSVPFYLPQVERSLLISGRTRRSFHPLFPGYVFVRPTADERSVIWRSGVVVSPIAVPDQLQLGEELAQIRRLQLAGATFTRLENIEPGDWVLIPDGAFSGYRGIVVRAAGRERLVVRISLLRQCVAVEFDRQVLRRAR
jgi:transcription antitermination factor NusG